MKVRRTKDLRRILALDARIFPGDHPVDVWDDRMAWWLCGDVAFAGVRKVAGESLAYLCRAGVAPEARGQGIQRRLIRVRLAWARRHALEAAVTYTSATNTASSNNLAACGFRMYRPANPWAGEQLYWIKEL